MYQRSLDRPATDDTTKAVVDGLQSDDCIERQVRIPTFTCIQSTVQQPITRATCVVHRQATCEHGVA